MKDNIIGILKDRITQISKDPKYFNLGHVLSVGDNIVDISGLHSAGLGEIVYFDKNTFGIIISLERGVARAVMIQNNNYIKPGQEVISTKQLASIPVSKQMLGRVVDPLSNVLDLGEDISYTENALLFGKEPGMIDRVNINTSLMTGIKAIDIMIPIGRGQRQLILGDKGIGKTQLALDTIINQKGKDLICIYASIGQKQSSIVQIYERLKELDAMEYSVIVNSSASDSCGMQYIAPFSACAIAEYFMCQGNNVLVIYDDLSKHAWAYRQISLLLKRSPGRDAYPGDIFSIHAGLLERAANVNQDYIYKKSGIKDKTGSITALPIVEIQSGDISGYIPTNIISITDGQIYLSSQMFNQGLKPAIDSSRSVSRVGGVAQSSIIRKLSSSVRLFIAQYRELADFIKLSSSLDESSKKILERGKRADILFNQDLYNPLSSIQICFELYALVYGYLDNISIQEVYKFLSISKKILQDNGLQNKIFNTLEDAENDFNPILDNIKELVSEQN